MVMPTVGHKAACYFGLVNGPTCRLLVAPLFVVFKGALCSFVEEISIRKEISPLADLLIN